MESIEQTRCMDALEPLLTGIVGAFDEAMAMYHREYSAAARADHTDSCAAHAVQNHVVANLERKFSEAPGVHFLTVRGMRVMNVGDILVASMKKLDSDGRHRNHDSQQQRDFDAQKPLPDIPPAAVRLRIGYEPDVAFTDVERVLIARPQGKSVVWQSQIIDGAEGCSWVDITPQKLPGFRDHKARRSTGE